MELREIEEVLEGFTKNTEDESLRTRYIDLMAEYLKDNKSSEELVAVVVKGFDIDHASNYYDYVASIPQNSLQSVWKHVRDSKTVSENKGNNGLKLVTGLLSLSFMKVGYWESMTGNIINKLILMIDDEKKPIHAECYRKILTDYFLEDIVSLTAYPQWDTLSISGNTSKRFAEILIQIITIDSIDKYRSIKQWATYGLKYADELIEKEKIEAKIPKSKVNDLQSIVDHYKEVEKQVRENVYEIASLEKTVKGLQEEIAKLNSAKRDLENEISSLHGDVEDHQKQIAEKDKELEARKKINDAADALKKNDEEGLLRDIANELKSEYRDFIDSKEDDMDVQLGEIYREKLKNIFKILAKKGIRME